MAPEIGEIPPSSRGNRKGLAATRTRVDMSMLFFTLAFVLCIVFSIAPLARLGGAMFFQVLPTNPLLVTLGSWLPVDLGFSSDVHASQVTTHVVLFLLLMALAFVIYGCCAWSIQYHQADSTIIFKLIWIGTCVAGLAFVFTPGMLSHDIFSYAGYGRLIALHQANPYFVPLSAYPHDPLLPLIDWKNTVAAYGPLWLVICVASALFPGSAPLQYVLMYRTLGFLVHFLNTLLVMNILRTMERPRHTLTVGTLLYAWNPLVLVESCLGGHNDAFMVTLILLGMRFCLRTENKTIKSFSDIYFFIPPLVAFTLATLVKFTAAPLIALFMIWTARKALYPTSDNAHSLQPEWRRTLLAVIAAGLLCGILLLAFYAPFWIGHSIPAILRSFTLIPSSSLAYGSIMFAIQKWIWAYGLPAQNWIAGPLYVLSLHTTWNMINLLTVVATTTLGGIWLWRTPTTQTLALAGLTLSGAWLLVTPWFFPWYIIWLVGLAAICLPIEQDRMGRALVISTLVFSASAFCIYLYYRGVPPLGSWSGFTFLTTIGPPLVTLGLCALPPHRCSLLVPGSLFPRHPPHE